MSVGPTSKTLNIGETVQLTGTKNPSTTSEGTQWTSSNTSVATVSNSGLVTAKSAGTATITFKNSSSTKSASCSIKVQNEFLIGRGDTSSYGYLEKYDGNGKKIWSINMNNGAVNIIQPTSDGNYLIGRGDASSYGYLEKYDGNGKKIWSINMNNGAVNTIIYP